MVEPRSVAPDDRLPRTAQVHETYRHTVCSNKKDNSWTRRHRQGLDWFRKNAGVRDTHCRGMAFKARSGQIWGQEIANRLGHVADQGTGSSDYKPHQGALRRPHYTSIYLFGDGWSVRAQATTAAREGRHRDRNPRPSLGSPQLEHCLIGLLQEGQFPSGGRGRPSPHGWSFQRGRGDIEGYRQNGGR